MLTEYASRNPPPDRDGAAVFLSVDQPLRKAACKAGVGAGLWLYCPFTQLSPPTTMQCRMICLYRDGVLIEKDKLAEEPAHTGNLVVEDWVDGSVFKRPVRQARLLTETHLIPSDIIPPLFEPDIIKITGSQMTLQGHQIGTRDGAAVHYIQAWVIRMTAPTDSILNP